MDQLHSITDRESGPVEVTYLLLPLPARIIALLIEILERIDDEHTYSLPAMLASTSPAEQRDIAHP